MAARRLVSAWKGLHGRRPVVVNTAAFSLLYATGDLCQQTMTGRLKYDVANTARVSVAGGGFGGPFYHYWYKFLDRRLPGTSVKVICKKLFADQAVAGIFGTFAFFTVTSLLERQDKIFDEALSKGPRTFLTGCLYWPLVQVVNFKLVSTRLKPIYVAVAGFFWTNIICYIKSHGLNAKRHV